MPHRMVRYSVTSPCVRVGNAAQGEVVLSIDGEPVKRSEFEYYFRKSCISTPAFFSTFFYQL